MVLHSLYQGEPYPQFSRERFEKTETKRFIFIMDRKLNKLTVKMKKKDQ